ncbi:MAG: trypsin-like serine protease [Fuerstiella sp.]|nr:trypsin-like serine protease [Fuerstiella sp.]MCP4512224.1 trypsin-like serine protease [Fuerstiella sp.]
MLRFFPRNRRFVRSSPSRQQQRVSALAITEEPLEIRRVLSAVTAAVTDVGSETLNAVNTEGETQLESSHQDGVQARIVNGTSTSDYMAVGIVNNGCTGTLIASDVVLTAAHCVERLQGGFIGDTDGTFEVNGQTYGTTKISVHPNYDANNFGAGYDIAVMRLDRPVNGITPFEINRATPQVGQILTLVGFGETGTSIGGSNGDFGNKTVGQTPIDNVTETHIEWNFDSHSESNTAPGDSGGPAFLEVNGQLFIAGITSGGDSDPHRLGDNSFDTRVDTLAAWIDQVAGTTDGGDTGGGDTGGGDTGGGDTGGGDTGGGDTGGGDTGGGDTGGGLAGTFSSTAVVAIRDDRPVTVSSVVQASGMSGTITDVNVTLDIDHTWNEDLTVTLISPSGTRVELFDAVGGDSHNFKETTLDQQAAVPIRAADAPFTGTFRPSGDLSGFNNEDPNGAWTLEVQDSFDLDGGQVNSFSVSLSTTVGGGDTGGDGGLAAQAIAIDQQYDLDTTGNDFENWGGADEKWMFGNNGWVFILPDGSLYEWDGSGGATGQLIATFSPEYHTAPELLYRAYDNSLNQGGPQDDTPVDLAASAIEIDQQYDLRTTGNLWEDWAGLGEKWLYSNVGWVYVTLDGALYQEGGNSNGSDRLIFMFSPEYHANPELLYDAYDNSLRQQRNEDDTADVFACLAEDDDDLWTGA